MNSTTTAKPTSPDDLVLCICGMDVEYKTVKELAIEHIKCQPWF